MRFVVKMLGIIMLLGITSIGLVIADLTLNQGSIVYGAMGRDALFADCRPILKETIVSKGGDGESIATGRTLALSRSSETGDELKAQVAFRTVSGVAYEGIFVCHRGLSGVHVQVEAKPVGGVIPSART